MKKIRKVLVVYYTRNYGTLNAVKKALRKNKVAANYVKRENDTTIKRRVKEGVDAVIVVGGDGTLLKASHFIEDTPAILISSSANVNEAFFSRATNKDAGEKIRRLAEGKYRTTPLMRLEAEINGKRLPFKALNEVYAGSEEPYHTARYELRIGRRCEEQKSSGIIIATPAGSHAWSRSAGGKVLPLTVGKIQYVVREPYVGRLAKPKMVQGVVGHGQKVTVTSNIWKRHRGIVVIDSYKNEFRFNNGDRLVVRAAKQPLNLIYF